MSTNPKDFSLVEVQKPYHVRTFLMKAEELRNRIKKAIDTGNLSVREVNEDGDIMEEAINVPLSGLVGFTAQLETGMVQIFKEGRDPEDTDGDDTEKPIFAFVRSEIHGTWVIGKTLKKLNGVEVDKPEYVVLRADSIRVAENTADNFITANLDWVIEMVVGDFEDMFPDAEADDFDDGE